MPRRSAADEVATVHNNFLYDFALRRQSLVSLNRVFGMGETVGLGDGSDSAQHKVSPTDPAAPKGEKRHPSSGRPGSTASDELTTSSRSLRSPYPFSRMASYKRARRVRFYRNGDRFFKGMVYAVSAERFRTFENLLASLTSSPLCDRRVMPQGVRHIFTMDGAKRVDDLDMLEEGQSYVCASSEVFRTLDYAQNEDPAWQYVHKVTSSGRQSSSRPASQGHASRADSCSSSRAKSASRGPHSEDLRPGPVSLGGMEGGGGAEDKSAMMSPRERKQYEDYQRSFVVPRLITVIRHGKRPREAVRLLLNRKTAQTFDQVMDDISEAIKLHCGKIRKLYAISGKLVTCLADFFDDDMVFLACGPEKIFTEDLDLVEAEIRQVRAYRPSNFRSKERVTLRRKSASNKNKTENGQNHSQISEISGGNSEANENESGSPMEKDQADISKIPMPELLTLKYDVGPLIGTGNFAVVLECKDKSTRRKYALKIINKHSCKGREKLLDNEVRILRRVKHPNIIRLIEDYSHQHRIFYIMELVKGGDLFDAIASSIKYTEQDASGILYNLASALHYLHSLKIVHRDVKPENLLIRQHDDGTKSLKLGDFGLATEAHSPLYTVCGTPTYVAPEVIAESGYGVKIDIWSAGVITYILLCGFPPFASENEKQSELFDLIMSASFDFPNPYWAEVSEQAKTLITRMLEIDADARLSAKQILEDKWVASDTVYDADLRRVVNSGLSTHFRRGHRPPTARNAGVQIIARTAMDKASRFFKGKKSLEQQAAEEIGEKK